MVFCGVLLAHEEYELTFAINAGRFNPVRISAGFIFALQNISFSVSTVVAVIFAFSAMTSLYAGEGGKARKMHKEKNLGQIFTPEYLVRDILDIANYQTSSDILGKHVIDNSCGDGAFLVEVVQRYYNAAKEAGIGIAVIKRELETYIHGIELDDQAYRSCIENLDETAKALSLPKISWDVKHTNTLDVSIYDGKMDYVVGNPPYVRVHNLEDEFSRVKQYSFCSTGMTDLYLVFYEIGLKMLREGGRLCYIAPSSWFNSLAGQNMRKFVSKSGWLREIVDLEHVQPFNATTYTAIVLFEKSQGKGFKYKTYKGPGAVVEIDHLDFAECYFDNAFYLGDKDTLRVCRKIKKGLVQEYVQVKNGFATLADDVFISDSFPFKSMIIPVIKASTGKWRKAFYPYDRNGKPLRRVDVFSVKSRSEYLSKRKNSLLKGKKESECPDWYLYGRTQALKDVWVTKYAINTVVKNISTIKFNRVEPGAGVYSGLYILSDVSEADIRDALLSEDFIKYVQVLRKYKSGGYYTFSSKDVKQFLNYSLHKKLSGSKKHCGKAMQLTFDIEEER